MMTERTGNGTDELLGALPPAPGAWTRSAEELPLLERALGLLDERCPRGDLRVYRRETDAALREVGLEPDEQRLRMLGRLRELRADG